MNNMFPIWTLSSLILSYTLGSPIFNNPSTGSDISINVTEGMEHKTRLMENNATQMNFTGFNMTSPIIGVIIWTSGCFAPTCHMDNLVDRMQNGDEEAGKSTWDPFGPGKK